MNGTCGTRETERCMQGFGGETWGERGRLEDLGIGRIIFKWIFKTWAGQT
jgi:hypothetical protein